MAKRLTDSNKWDKPWYRKLPAEYKCLWDFITSKCDMIGIWDKDFEAATYHIGEEVLEEKAAVLFCDQIKIFNERKWLIIDFVKFQYGEIGENPKSPIQKKVKDLLKKIDYIYPIDRVYNTPQVEVEVKEKVEVMVKEEVKVKRAEFQLTFPFDSKEFREKWNHWRAYLSEIKKPYNNRSSEQAALQLLGGFSEKTAIEMINQSIRNQWKQIFEIKDNGKNIKQPTTDTRSNGSFGQL